MIRVPDIARLLAERVDRLVGDLLPGGHREGHEWRAGSVGGEPGASLGMHLIGHKRGIWRDFATGQQGDALDLVRAVLGLDMPAALRWSRDWLGLADDVPPPRRPRASSSDNISPAARQARALDIWRDAIEDIAGTPAEAYLRSRGLDPMRLPSLHGLGRWPATLRYSERAVLDPARECRALIAAVHGSADGSGGLVRAVQRILLAPDGAALRDARGPPREVVARPDRRQRGDIRLLARS